MAKYKVGDKVLVKKELSTKRTYKMSDGGDWDFFVSSMIPMLGTVATISMVGNKYRLEEDKSFCWWTDEMFDGLYVKNGNLI